MSTFLLTHTIFQPIIANMKFKTNLKKAVCLFCTDGVRILSTTRRGENEKWGLPGGKIDDGERPIDAIVRETFEETGVSLEMMKLIPVFVDICDDYECMTFFYQGRIESNKPKVKEDGIWVGWKYSSDLVNGPFGEYNSKLLATLGKIQVVEFIRPNARKMEFDVYCLPSIGEKFKKIKELGLRITIENLGTGLANVCIDRPDEFDVVSKLCPCNIESVVDMIEEIVFNFTQDQLEEAKKWN